MVDQLREVLIIDGDNLYYRYGEAKSLILTSEAHYKLIDTARAMACKDLIPIWIESWSKIWDGFASLRILIAGDGVFPLNYESGKWSVAGHPDSEEITRAINNGFRETMRSNFMFPLINGSELRWIIY